MKSNIIKGALAMAVVGGLALGALYYFVIRSDAPPAVSLEAALDSLSTQQTEQSQAETTTAVESTVSSNDGNYDGTWTIVNGSSSFAGYRVQEELAGIGSTTAVGRTTGVTGSLTFDGASITALQVTADLSTLASDKTMRDQQLKNQALQTNTYKTASFVLTSPVSIGSVPAEGQTISKTISGNLTLHGVTKAIQLTVQGQIQNSQLVVVGSTEISFADYNISQPQGASVLSIEDHGTLEIQLLLAQA